MGIKRKNGCCIIINGKYNISIDCKVPLMQSFSGFDFLIKYTYSDSSSHADYEYHLIFSINWSPHREKCKILRRCQNSRKILLIEKQRFILYTFVCRSYQ